MTKRPYRTLPAGWSSILALAEIATAMQAFNDGDANADDTLDAIAACIAAHRSGPRPRPDAA